MYYNPTLCIIQAVHPCLDTPTLRVYNSRMMSNNAEALAALNTPDKYGINMRKWCDEHENKIRAALESGAAPSKILIWHEKKLAWLQHERLVHLLVLIMTVIIELFAIGIMFFATWTYPVSMIVMYGILVLLGFYFRHYFFLENRVQHWYKIADALQGLSADSGTFDR